MRAVPHHRAVSSQPFVYYFCELLGAHAKQFAGGAAAATIIALAQTKWLPPVGACSFFFVRVSVCVVCASIMRACVRSDGRRHFLFVVGGDVFSLCM